MQLETILADRSASISELKKNPSGIIAAANGHPVAILNHNKPAFYCITPALFALMLEAVEDFRLAALVSSRMDEEDVEVSWEDL